MDAETEGSGLTALHFALNGRMETMSSARGRRNGEHEACISLLLRQGKANPMGGNLG